MTLPRAVCRIVSRVLIGVLLCAQLAVASYACPGWAQQSGAEADMARAASVTAARNASGGAAAALATGGPCNQLDPDATNLCAEHCRFGQQRADTAPLPAVHAAIPTLLYSLPLQPVHAHPDVWLSPALDSGPAAAHPPPHAILHCVFRI